MTDKNFPYSIPPLVEFGVETAIIEIEQLRDLMDALAQLGGPIDVILREERSEVIQ